MKPAPDSRSSLPLFLYTCTRRWAQHSFSNINSEDGDFKTDRSGCGASPPPPQPTQDGDGTIHIINSNHDLEDSRSRERAPPPPYGYREQTYFNLSEHKTLEASCNHAAPQDERNTDQTTLVSSLLSPTCSAATGPPGPPSGDGDRPRSVDGDGFHQPTVVVGEAEVAELAASLLAASLPEYQAASSSLGASSGRLPERPVDATRKNAMRTSIEGEGCDELANLDARAGSLLEHCRQLLSAPPTDDAEQVFMMMCCSAYIGTSFVTLQKCAYWPAPCTLTPIRFLGNKLLIGVRLL